MNPILRILTFLLLGAFASSAAALDCSERGYSSAGLDGDTRAALQELDDRFKSYTVDVNFASERNAILVEDKFAFAKPDIFNSHFLWRYCQLLVNETNGLADVTRSEYLEEAKESLRIRVNKPSLASTLVNISSVPNTGGQMLLAFANTGGYAGTSVDVMPGLFVDVGSEHSDALLAANTGENTTRYIQPSPYVVNISNNNFVQVASVRDFDGAVREMKRLKRNAPQFDFVVYGPYEGNPWHAIMMATWVSYPVAEEALKDAKKYVNKGSRIWTCRSKGSSC